MFHELALPLLTGIIENDIKLIMLTLSARIELVTAESVSLLAAVHSHKLFAYCNWRQERFLFYPSHLLQSRNPCWQCFFFFLRDGQDVNLQVPAPVSTHHWVALASGHTQAKCLLLLEIIIWKIEFAFFLISVDLSTNLTNVCVTLNSTLFTVQQSVLQIRILPKLNVLWAILF